MYFEKILKLTNATGASGSFVGHCPTHNDKSKSLSITKEADGKILLKCHAGCSQKKLIEYLVKNNSWGEPIKDYEKIKNLWEESIEINENDLAYKYIQSRGISLNTLPKSLRLNSHCYNKELNTQVDAIIAKVQNSQNNLIAIQRIYLNKNGNKLKVDCPKKILGSFAGGHVELKSGLSEEIIHLTEGIETGLAIFSSLNETVWCSLSATNLSKIQPDKTVKTIHIWADKDVSETGQKESRKAAETFRRKGIKVFLHLPLNEIPQGSKGIDFLDIYKINPSAISEARNSKILFNVNILPIKMPYYHLPKINEQYLPFVIREWVSGQAERLNVPPEMIVVPLLTMIGSLIGRKIALRPKKNDQDWNVYGNVWGLIIAPPGTKKTPIFNSCLKILNNIQKREQLKFQEQINSFADEKMEIGIKIKSLEKKLEDAIKAEKPEDEKSIYKKTLSDLKKRKTELDIFPKRYTTNSFSLEKLFELLKENQNGILIPNDEISSLFESFKKKGHESTRPFLLTSWDGDGSFKYDILSRPSVSLDGICLTLLGGTQPSIISKMLNEMRQSHNDDGFIQRFQFIAYPNQDIIPKFVDSGLNPEAHKKLNNLLEEICNLDGSKFGEKYVDCDSYIAQLTPEAYSYFADYMDKIEKEVHASESGGYRNHLNKFGKLLSGLIIHFHVIDGIETKRRVNKVRPHVVEMAIRWCELFKAHAKKLYDTDYNFESISGFALAKKIVEGKIEDGTSLRKIYRNEWQNLKTFQEVESACFFLEKHKWLTLTELKPLTERPTSIILFDPELQTFLSKEQWHE